MKRLIVILAVMALGISAVHAQVRVTKSAGDKTTLDMTGFAAGQGAAQAFRSTLENDLRRSGWFSLVRQGTGEFRMLGSCEERGGEVRVECQVYGTARKRVYLSKAYRESAQNAKALAHIVADEIVEAITGKKGIASTKIVMVGTRSRAKELYICDSDGGNLIQLTRDNNVSVAPSWGPDGGEIAYTSYLRRFPDVYVITLATGNRRKVSDYAGLNTGAAISPDGRDMALVLSKDGNPEIYIKNLRSGRLTRVTNTGRAAEASPCWSPDGRSLAFVSDSSGRPQIYTVSRTGGRPERITMRGSENVAPDWGPNGLIAYASRIGGRYQIHIIDPQTRETKALSLDYADYEDPSWAPDGRHIAATRTVNYNRKVYILDTMGDPPVALTDYAGDWYSPAWSPR